MATTATQDYSAQNARDAALVERIKQGDDEAFKELLDKYNPMLSGQAWRFTQIVNRRDPSLSMDDFLQITALELLRAARAYDPSRGVGFFTFARQWVSRALYKQARNAGALWERRNTKDEDYIPLRARFITELDTPVGAEGDMTLGELLPSGAPRSVEDGVLLRCYLEQLIRRAQLSPAMRRIIDAYLANEHDSGVQAARAAGVSTSMYGLTLQRLRSAARRLHEHDEVTP